MSAPVVDVHVHLAPLLADDALPSGVARAEGRLVLDGHRVGPPALYDTEKLLKWLDGTGVDTAWVSPPPPFFRQQLGAGAANWATSLNEGILARVAGHERLAALAYLPLDQPVAALAEVARLSDVPGFVGWAAAAGGRSLALDDAQLGPLWSAVESSGRPILLHPGSTPDSRLVPHYLSNLLGNPVETTVAAAQLVFGDVLGRHPGLRVVLVHCGGAVPALAGRWQQGLDTARPGVGPLTLAPRDAVRRFWVDALAHDPALVDLARAVIGPDKVVLGSDWPFPMGLTDPVGALGHLPATDRDLITRTNVRALAGDAW